MITASPNLRAEAIEIPMDSDGQVEATIGKMREYAIADAQTPEIQRDVRAAIKKYLGNPLYYCLWRWVKDRMRFTNDQDLARLAGLDSQNPIVEILVRPLDISRQHAMLDESGRVRGDCDDYTMYLACLCICAGIPCSFVTVGADSTIPQEYSHVYLRAFPNHARAVALPLDASHGQQPGWEVENRTGKIREWPVASTEQGGWS